MNGYTASYRACGTLYHLPFRDIKLNDLQNVIDTCGKNYPTLRKLKVLFNQLYDYAIKHDVCNKNYSEYVDVVKHKNKNPNKNERTKFEKSEVERLWDLKDDKYYQIILMLIYNGCRISEFLDLKKENDLQKVTLKIKNKYGKNSILKGTDFEKGAKAKERNEQIGGHKA